MFQWLIYLQRAADALPETWTMLNSERMRTHMDEQERRDFHRGIGIIEREAYNAEDNGSPISASASESPVISLRGTFWNWLKGYLGCLVARIHPHSSLDLNKLPPRQDKREGAEGALKGRADQCRSMQNKAEQ